MNQPSPNFEQSCTSSVWQEPEEEWSPSCVSATVKHSSSHMHWGCFSWQGVRPIVPLHGSVTGNTHVQILSRYAIPTMHCMFPHGDGRQCSTPQIKSCSSIPCKQGFPWLAQSPDLNPIENLWA